MLSVLVLAAAVSGASPQVDWPGAAPPRIIGAGTCDAATMRGVADPKIMPDQRPTPNAHYGVQRLDQMPRAALMRTVMRTVGGCQVPVIIRYERQPAGPPAPSKAVAP